MVSPAQLSALSGHVPNPPFFSSFLSEREEGITWVSDCTFPAFDWPLAVRWLRPRRRQSLKTSRRSAVELHNNNKRRRSRGPEEETDWKETPHCDSRCAVLKVTLFYILFLPRRNPKFFYFSKSNASTSFFKDFNHGFDPFTPPPLSAAGELFVFVSVDFSSTAASCFDVIYPLHAHNRRDICCFNKYTTNTKQRRVIKP